MAGTTYTFDALGYGATLMTLCWGREMVNYDATVAVLEPTGHIGGTSTGGLGLGDIVTTAKDRWGYIKELLQYIGRNPPYNRTDNLEQVKFSANEMRAAINAILLDKPDKLKIIKYARIKEVFTSPVTGAITAIWLQNDDLYLANHSTHDGSYEIDLAAKVVKCQNGRNSENSWDEPMERPDADGKLSRSGFNPGRYEPDNSRGYDRFGNRFVGLTQTPPQGMVPGSGVPGSQGYGWRFEYMYDTPGHRPWIKPSGWTEADSREVIDIVTASSNPVTGGGSYSGSVFPMGGLAQAISGTVSGSPGRYASNGCDLPGIYTNPWCEASYDDRVRIQEAAAYYVMGCNWTCGNHLSIPENRRTSILRYQLPNDTFSDAGEYTLYPGWPPAYYIRDCRSIVGQYTMTVKNTMIIGGVDYTQFPDPISIGGYHIDVHSPIHGTRADGRPEKEGGVAYTIERNYQIPARACVPPFSVCPNITVSFGASGTAGWRASFRMEFTATICAQAMGIWQGIAFKTGRTIQQVPYSELRAALLLRGAFLNT